MHCGSKGVDLLWKEMSNRRFCGENLIAYILFTYINNTLITANGKQRPFLLGRLCY